MKKIIILAFIAFLSLGLVSCGKTEAPLTEAQQAEKYGLSVEEYKEQKDAAARMNMTIEQHLNMDDTMEMDHSNMEMSDDSHMIEDDAEMMDDHEMTDDEKHMEEFHSGEDYVPNHGADEHN